MRLICYPTSGEPPKLIPAPMEREWMDRTNSGFAYRCLPLNIANAHGWEIFCASSFTTAWNGSNDIDAVTVIPEPGTKAIALSHFGHGILTFHVPCIFRTEPGYDLWTQGPVNLPKDGIAPLTGVIETDWAPYTFTMNWKFTRPGLALRFEQGEPFCHVFPVKRGLLEEMEPQVRPIAEDPSLKRQLETWTANRSRFNAELKTPGSEAQAQRWQKGYYRGVDIDNAPAPIDDHHTRLRLRPFSP